MWENEPSHSQGNSHLGNWSPEGLPNLQQYRVQNPSLIIVLYIIKKPLKRRCLKWARITHLDIQNTSYDQKKCRESNFKLTIWLPTTKSQELTRLTFFQVACDIPLERSWWGLQRFFKLHPDRRFAQKVMGLQSRGSPDFGNFGTPTWESWDKKPFECGPRGEAHSIL
jgi:hypothetical protein